MNLFGFFFALALGLPFAIELYLDQTLKRPGDIEAKLGLPFFITLPKTNGSAKVRLLDAEKRVPLLSDSASPTAELGARTAPLRRRPTGISPLGTIATPCVHSLKRCGIV